MNREDLIKNIYSISSYRPDGNNFISVYYRESVDSEQVILGYVHFKKLENIPEIKYVPTRISIVNNWVELEHLVFDADPSNSLEKSKELLINKIVDICIERNKTPMHMYLELSSRRLFNSLRDISKSYVEFQEKLYAYLEGVKP